MSVQQDTAPFLPHRNARDAPSPLQRRCIQIGRVANRVVGLCEQYTAKTVCDRNTHGTPREPIWWASNASAPIRLRLGNFTTGRVVGDRFARTCIQSPRYRLGETNQMHQTRQRRTPPSRPPDRQHGTAIQAPFLLPGRRIPTDVRGSCGCSGAGCQPSRQARQLWLPLFPALTGLSRDQSGWLSPLTGRITEGSRQAFFRRLSLLGTVIHLAGALQYDLDDANGGVRHNIGVMSCYRGRREKLGRG
jgi:hypothetical protein